MAPPIIRTPVPPESALVEIPRTISTIAAINEKVSQMANPKTRPVVRAEEGRPFQEATPIYAPTKGAMGPVTKWTMGGSNNPMVMPLAMKIPLSIASFQSLATATSAPTEMVSMSTFTGSQVSPRSAL